MTGERGDGRPTGDGGATDHAPLAGDRGLLELAVHDLRSPLTTVAGFAELLANRPEAIDGRARADALAAVRRGAGHAAALLEALAELLAPGATERHPAEAVDVAAALRRVVRADRRYHGVTVRADPACGRVSARPDRLAGLLAVYLTDVVTRAPGHAIVTVSAAPGEVVLDAALDRVAGGLAREVTRRLAEGMGGRVEAEVGPGGPGRLTCRLPAV